MLNGLTSALACLDPARKIPIINQRTRDLLRLIGRKADPEGAEALTLLIGQKNIHDAFDLDVYSQSLPLMKPLPRVKKAAHQPRTLGVKSELSVMARYAVRKTAVKRDHNKLTNKFRLAAMWKYIVDEERYDAFIPEWRDGKSLLIEAKTTTEGILGRMLVRQAIGQLFDYRFMHFDHHDKPVELALLTPKKPAADVLDLLKTLNIHSIYFEGKHLRGV